MTTNETEPKVDQFVISFGYYTLPKVRHISIFGPERGLSCNVTAITKICLTVGPCFRQTEHQEFSCWISTSAQGYATRLNVIVTNSKTVLTGLMKILLDFHLHLGLSQWGWTTTRGLSSSLFSTKKNRLKCFSTHRFVTEVLLNAERILMAALFKNKYKHR